MFKHMFKHMASKTITIKDSAYALAKANKRPNESFSELFIRTFERKKPDFSKWIGIWDDKTAKGVRKAIQKARKESLRLSNERTKRLGLQ